MFGFGKRKAEKKVVKFVWNDAGTALDNTFTGKEKSFTGWAGHIEIPCLHVDCVVENADFTVVIGSMGGLDGSATPLRPRDVQANRIDWHGGTVVSGVMRCGEWTGGTFAGEELFCKRFSGGTFAGGKLHCKVFADGTVTGGEVDCRVCGELGEWRRGTFAGIRFSGEWRGGTFESGEFDGVWLDGYFKGGTFKGEWRGGTWSGGVWNGVSSVGDGTFDAIAQAPSEAVPPAAPNGK